ncbi:MAG: dGTP triphosphohydrolase [Bacillota bacterium]
MESPRRAAETAEERWLRPGATRARDAYLTRVYPERGPDDYRTDFQRDRDRIIYSTAFRRLQYKTQVYVTHEGDFYRTRLTHTIEVVQHARTLARALRVNEDLCEAIALGHDLGHPPFGHAGEQQLDHEMSAYGGFDHNRQGLRVVDLLEQRYAGFPGLNLCFATREGLARHLTPFDDPGVEPAFASLQPSLEAQVVNIADELAYCAHDLDDALDAGLLRLEDCHLPGIPMLEEALEKAGGAGDRRIEHRLVIRNLIELFNVDAITWSEGLLGAAGVTGPGQVRVHPSPLVALSPEGRLQLNRLREFLVCYVYQDARVVLMTEKGKYIVAQLFAAILARPQLLPRPALEEYERADDGAGRYRVVCDFISSLTDQFASDLYAALRLPRERARHLF